MDLVVSSAANSFKRKLILQWSSGHPIFCLHAVWQHPSLRESHLWRQSSKSCLGIRLCRCLLLQYVPSASFRAGMASVDCSEVSSGGTFRGYVYCLPAVLLQRGTNFKLLLKKLENELMIFVWMVSYSADFRLLQLGFWTVSLIYSSLFQRQSQHHHLKMMLSKTNGPNREPSGNLLRGKIF